MSAPLLFSPLTIRGLTLRNRTVLAPMCQYSARDGYAGDWHLVHLGKFALGGMGVVMTEATAVEKDGRITHGDLGIWSDDHIAGLKRATDFIRSQGAASAIQIGHAGRKASSQRPWHGHGELTAKDIALRNESPWETVAPTAESYFEKGILPTELKEADIGRIVRSFGEAAMRADRAGFDIVEIHGAHGYLIASFLSPAVNKRSDAYGGDLAGRMRFALEVVREVRSRWPENKPLFVRISTEDGVPGAWSVADSVILGKELKRLGVDVIDCSSGGARNTTILTAGPLRPGYQVPYSSTLRRECQIMTMAVGLILDGRQAEDILQSGDADLIAIGREALFDPYWAHHAAHQLEADADFTSWQEQSGWWLNRRARSLKRAANG